VAHQEEGKEEGTLSPLTSTSGNSYIMRKRRKERKNASIGTKAQPSSDFKMKI